MIRVAAGVSSVRLGLPALVPILVLAVLLRAAGLGHAPLWMDEASTLGFARLPWGELFGGIGAVETNPPAYYVLMKGWIAVAGSSDLAVRVPSVLFGVAGVAAVWALTRAAFGAPAADWAGLLAAAQAHLLDHSREARVYALLVLVVAMAAWAGQRVAAWSEGRGGVRPWGSVAGMAAAGGAALLLHNTGVIAAGCVFLGAGVAALCRGGPRWGRLWMLGVAGVGALALGAPGLVRVVQQAGVAGGSASWIPVPDAVLTAQVALSVLAAPMAGFRDGAPGMVAGFFLLAACVVAVALVWAVLAARRLPDAAGLLAALLAAVLGMYAVSQVVPVLLERTLLFTLVFFLPLLGAALAAVPWAPRAVVLAGLMVAQAPGLALVFGPARHGEDWRALAAVLREEQAATGWPVLALGGFEALALERYLPPGDPARPHVSLTPELGRVLTDRVTRAMTGAAPVPARVDATTLCEMLGGGGGVLLMLRASAVLAEMQEAAETVLTAAGGTGEGVRGVPQAGSRLGVQRWPGACAAGR